MMTSTLTSPQILATLAKGGYTVGAKVSTATRPDTAVDDIVCAKERVLKVEESSIAAASELRYKLKIINSEPDQ
jgi:hypothetical protein